jgi:hypothetical protein
MRTDRDCEVSTRIFANLVVKAPETQTHIYSPSGIRTRNHGVHVGAVIAIGKSNTVNENLCFHIGAMCSKSQTSEW